MSIRQSVHCPPASTHVPLSRPLAVTRRFAPLACAARSRSSKRAALGVGSGNISVEVFADQRNHRSPGRSASCQPPANRRFSDEPTSKLPVSGSQGGDAGQTRTAENSPPGSSMAVATAAGESTVRPNTWRSPLRCSTSRRRMPLSIGATDLRCGLILDANGDEQSDLLFLGAGKPTFLVSKKDLPDADLAKRFGLGATDSPPLLSAHRCDLDQDGRSDIVGLTKDGRAVFLQGDGEGKLSDRDQPFGPAVGNLTGLRAVAAMDVNGDGVPDLIAWTPDGVKVFLGQSNGNHGLKLAFTGVRDNNNAGAGQKN